MSQYDSRYGKKLSESYNDFHIPDQFIVTDNKDANDIDNMFNNSATGVRKNIIIQQGQQITLDPNKLKQMKDQTQFMSLMTQGLFQQQLNSQSLNLGGMLAPEEGLVRSKSSNKLQADMLEGMYPSKQIKLEDKGIIKNQSSASLKDENIIALQNIKGNVKNAYIKKINSLISMQGDEEKDGGRTKNFKQSIHDQSSSNSGNMEQKYENDEIKMLKNRESARNSRQRKKLYIGLLERKVEDLTSQIEGLRQQTEISFKHIHGIVEQNPCLKGMIIEQAQILDQLTEKINQENVQELEKDEQIQLFVDSYKLRFSAAGSRRKQYIKYCFQNIAKAMLEGNYGPLLFGQSGLSKNYHQMEDEEFNCYVSQLKDVTGLMDENQTYKTLGIVRKILEHKKNQKYLIKTLRRQLKELRQKQQGLEDIMDDISNQLSPVQFAQFLTSINKVGFYFTFQQSDKICLKEEYQQVDNSKLKIQDQQINPYTQQLINQLQMELMINNQKYQNSNLLPIAPMLIDPLAIKEMMQNKGYPGMGK